MEYIYARVSTDTQTTDGQLTTITKAFPQASVVTETASGAKSRPILKALLGELNEGDTLIVAALDRLGRRTSEVLAIIEDLDQRGVILKSLREGVDYSTPVGRLVTQVLCSVAELERNLISERTKAGLEAAKAQGKQLGRPRGEKHARIQRGIALVQRGWSIRKAAERCDVHHTYLAAKVRELSE